MFIKSQPQLHPGVREKIQNLETKILEKQIWSDSSGLWTFVGQRQVPRYEELETETPGSSFCLILKKVMFKFGALSVT